MSNFGKHTKNKMIASVHFALLFVQEHRELFEEWLNKKLTTESVSHLDKVFEVDDKE